MRTCLRTRTGSDTSGSIVLYNNSYGSTHGTIHISAASMDKGSGDLRQRSLAEGLAIGWDDSLILRYRDHGRGMEYLRRATDIHRYGMTIDLRGYQYAVLLDWQEMHSTAEQPWDRLCDSLNGAGVHNLDHALSLLRLRPLHEALEHALHPGAMRVLAELGRELLRAAPPNAQAKDGTQAAEVRNSAVKEPTTADKPETQLQLSTSEQLRLGDWLHSVDGFAWRAAEILQPQSAEAFVAEFRGTLVPLVSAALRLPVLERMFSTVWPGTVRTWLPSWEPGASAERTWAPVMAWALLRSLPGTTRPEERFDQLQLREALGAIFSTGGLEGEDVWRAAARVRVLLAYGDQRVRVTAYSRSFWEDPDVRWLAGVNESGGKTYFNQEATDEVLAWMVVPSLLAAAERAEPKAALLRLEEVVAELSASAKASSYELTRFLAEQAVGSQKASAGGSGAAAAEELPGERPTTGKKIVQSEKRDEDGRR